MSLKALIEGKTRRTDVLPIRVGDMSAAAAEVATCRSALAAQQAKTRSAIAEGGEPSQADSELEERLRRTLAEALQREAATVVQVQLQSLPPDEWDAVLDPLDPEDPDLTPVRAVLVAASCVDEELRDPDWWEAQFTRPEWTKGELLEVNNRLLALNLHVPAGHAGKG